MNKYIFFGQVRGQKISSKFLLLQSSNDLDRFSALMKITGRFVHVKNADFHLVGTRSAWISSGNWVGRGLRRVLPGYSESGIYSVWARKWDTLLKRSGQYFLRGKIQKLKGHGDDGGQKALSWGQVRLSFILLAVGGGIAGVVQFFEVAWFVNMEKYIYNE